MKISVILAHPDEKSFNHAIAQTVVKQLGNNGHSVLFQDLYKEKFDPLLVAKEIADDAPLPSAIRAHCEEIAEADHVPDGLYSGSVFCSTWY